MAGFQTFRTYDADSYYPNFKGLQQYGDLLNADHRYTADAVNIATPGGVLQPMAKCTLLDPQLDHPIETLMHLYRRWYTASDDKDILIAASHGKLYSMLPNGTEWTELTMPDGVTEFESNTWSWVTYEINPTGSIASVDVLLISNAVDGMYMVRGDTLAISKVQCPKKYGVIERYAERIWGGAITDDPDQLQYSAPYDPTDWNPNYEIPEDGAGDLTQPSWDGDSFTALKSFGAQLIAFKRTRVWRVLGTDPGEYTFKEQYGGGAPYAATIAVDAERIFMLTDQGVAYYDGSTVNPFQQRFAQDFWRRMNKAAMEQSCACLYQKKYYISVPIDNSEINNAVMIYDTVDGTWLIRTDISVESWMPTEKALYFTSSTTPGQIWLYQEDAWYTGESCGAGTKWVTPWTDLNAYRVDKGPFVVYFLPEAKSRPVRLKFTLETEFRKKTKEIVVQPILDIAERFNKKSRQKQISFWGTGRRFRLTIESDTGEAVWRLIGGITITADIAND